MDPIDSKIKDYLERTSASRISSKDLAEADNEVVPEELVSRVKCFFPRGNALPCPHCGKAITPFKTPLSKQKAWNDIWAVLAAASFAGSFLVPRYFFQFLAAFLFFGFRWIVDRRAARTQILIYKALKENEGPLPKGRDLHHPSSHL